MTDPRREDVDPGQEAWLDRLRARGALIEGHFRLSSGLHSPHYVQCALFLQHPDEARRAAEALAGRLRERIAEPPAACPQCQAGIPVEKPGSRPDPGSSGAEQRPVGDVS